MKTLFLVLLVVFGCAHNSYESASERLRSSFKEVSLPFPTGTKYFISTSPFHSKTRAGNEYKWSFDVPYGTPVTAIEDGKVLSVYAPGLGGGCDQKYFGKGHNIKVLHSDGTVALYLHVEIKVKLGQMVKQNEVIAVTAQNGVVCAPQLHLMAFKNVDKHAQTIPLKFKGVPGEIAKKGDTGIVP